MTGTRTGPTFGENSEINEEATLLVNTWLRSEWLVRRWEPDTFIDYAVERRVGGEPTGEVFFAQ